MSTTSSRRATSILLFSLLYIQGVFGKGGKAKEAGHSFGDAADTGSDLGLTPLLTAIFALTVTAAIITFYQLGHSLNRFKSLQLPESEPTLPYDVGILFRVLLASYTTIYLLHNILYAIYIASFGDTIFVPDTFSIGWAFTAQLATVLFYATLLSIIAYRQRIQLNPSENWFNLKAFLDGWLLAIILILGVTYDAVVGTRNSREDLITALNLSTAIEVFTFLGSLDVAISSYMARVRLSNADIQDKIINISTFVVSPIVVTGGIFRIIDIAILNNAARSFDSNNLLVAFIVIDRIVSIATVWCCLRMGAPPKPPKSSDKGAAAEGKV